MDDHTEALDFVFTLLGWDRTTDFIIKKETIDKENHYLIDLNTNLVSVKFKGGTNKLLTNI